MGYSLTPAQLAEADASAKALQQQSTVNDDDIEKLKALESLKLDNVSVISNKTIIKANNIIHTQQNKNLFHHQMIIKYRIYWYTSTFTCAFLYIFPLSLLDYRQ